MRRGKNLKLTGLTYKKKEGVSMGRISGELGLDVG